MAKDAYWFRHDANAHRDTKILRLRAKWGWEGYGAFWGLIELMREQDGGEIQRSDIPVFAHDMRFDRLEQLVDDCCAWNLFQCVDEKIHSDRLYREIVAYQSSIDQRSNAGKISAARRSYGRSLDERATTVERPFNDFSTQTERTDRQRGQRSTESTDREEKEGFGGKGETAPPSAAPAGPQRPAEQPDVEQLAESASQQLGPSVIDFGGLPPQLRLATERARLKVDADAEAKAQALAHKTADYHAAQSTIARSKKREAVSPIPAPTDRDAALEAVAKAKAASPYSARGAPPEPDDFDDPPGAGGSA